MLYGVQWYKALKKRPIAKNSQLNRYSTTTEKSSHEPLHMIFEKHKEKNQKNYSWLGMSNKRQLIINGRDSKIKQFTQIFTL